MPTTDDLTLRSAFRRSPVRMGFFAAGPLVLALAQLLNSLFAGLPTYVSFGFAVLMACYAILYSRYHLAQLHLQSLEELSTGRPGRSVREHRQGE